MERMCRGTPCLLGLALLALTGSTAAAAGDAAVARGPSREPDPYCYKASKAAIPPEFLEEAASCVIYAGTTYLVEPDGTIETITHEVTRLNGRKGIEKLGEYRNIAYDPAYQKLTLNEACIHKPSGRVAAVQPRHIQLRDVGTDFQVYDHEKQLIVSFPSLEVGDIIEVKWTLRGRNPEHGGRFFTSYTFGDPQYPVLVDELRVRLPRNMPFHHATVGGMLKPMVREEGSCRLYTWQARNCQRLPQDDNLPSREDLRLGVVCSTFSSWGDVASWKHHLRAGCWESSPEVRRVVAEVTRGLQRPEEKARALTYWLRHKVRYVSVGEKHDYTPHAPSEVLANRFGDCKDTSQLLAVMLREAGISVALATLGALDDGQILPDVPSPWGTHAILVASIDGKDHWIDTTATLAPWDSLPREDRGRLCYVVDERGKLRLQRTPAVTAEDYRVDQTTEVWVGSDGTSRCHRVARYHGLAALGQRDTFLEVPPGERRRQVTIELQDANSRSRLLDLKLDEAALRDCDRPVTVDMEFEIPGHFSGSPDKEGSFSDSKVWGRLLSCNLDYERTIALNLGTPCELRHRYIVHLPPACTLEELPSDREIPSAWGSFARTVRAGKKARSVEIDFRTRIEKPTVEPADFEAFRRFHEDVSGAFRAWLTLKPVAEASAIPVLEAVLQFAPEDSASALALARVYLGAGREAEARRVLRRALHYHGKEVALWQQLVHASADELQREAVLRELVEHFPQEPQWVLHLTASLIDHSHDDEARQRLEPLIGHREATIRAMAHYLLARCSSRESDPASTLRHLDAAEKADPDALRTIAAQVLRGGALEAVGRNRDAEQAYEAALALDHDAMDALAGLIRLGMALGKQRDVLDHLRHYVVLVGHEPGGLLQAAEWYLQLKRWDDALDLAVQAGTRVEPGRAHRILGLIYRHKDNAESAACHLALAPKDPAVVSAALDVEIGRGKLERVPALLGWVENGRSTDAELRDISQKARRVLQRRVQLARQTASPASKTREWEVALDACACAEEEYSCGSHQSAAELVRAVLEKGFDVPAALALRGRLALNHGHLGRALADAEQALRQSALCGTAYYVRGRVRLERAEGGALEDLERSVSLSGRTDPEALHALAEALFEVGRRDDALQAQRQAVKLRPADSEMGEQLNRFEKAAAGGSH